MESVRECAINSGYFSSGLGHRGRQPTKPSTESEFIVKKFLAVAAVASALFLTGCSQVGAAATIGDVKITQAKVQGSVDSILAARVGVDTSQMQLETGAALTLGQLRFFVLTALLQATSKDLKITVTKAEIDTRRASITDQVGGVASLPSALVGAGIAAENLDAYIEAISLSDKISQVLTASGVAQADLGTYVQKLFVEKAATLGVTINPRYGKWDPTVADGVATDPASSAVTPATK